MHIRTIHFCFAVSVWMLLLLSAGKLSAQWQAYTPALPDTVGIYDLRIAHGNDQVAWGVAMQYDINATTYNWVPAPTLFFTKTKDGGETWSGGTIPMGPEPYASNVCPLSHELAWASGVDSNFTSYVLRTTDGGQSWQRMLEDKFTGPTSYVDFVHFWDEQNGIVAGDPAPSDTDPVPFFEIYRTTDGGATWQRVPSANIPLPNNEYGAGGDYDVRGDHIWFSAIDPNDGGGKRIYHSPDRGQSWQAIDPPDTRFVAWSFADSLHGIVVNPRPAANLPITIRYTADGGANWTRLPGFNPPNQGADWALIPGSYFILSARRTNYVTGPFINYLSKDLGQTWQEISTNENVEEFYFSSPSVGYAGETRPSDHAFRMYKYKGSPLSGLLANRALAARIAISPNPTADVATVEVEVEQPCTFLLLLNDTQGRLINRRLIDHTTRANARFDLENLPNGTYILTISTENGHAVRQIIKYR